VRAMAAVAVLAGVAVACRAPARPAAPPSTLGTTAPAVSTAELLRFSYRPADAREPATTISIWMAGDATGNLVAMRSSRVATSTGRLLQETAYRRGVTDYTIVDHGACHADADVQPPSAATVGAVIADSVGPLALDRPKADISDGQVVMRIAQPGPDLTSRRVTLIEAATRAEVAVIDQITLEPVSVNDVTAPLHPLACSPAITARAGAATRVFRNELRPAAGRAAGRGGSRGQLVVGQLYVQAMPQVGHWLYWMLRVTQSGWGALIAPTTEPSSSGSSAVRNSRRSVRRRFDMVRSPH